MARRMLAIASVVAALALAGCATAPATTPSGTAPAAAASSPVTAESPAPTASSMPTSEAPRVDLDEPGSWIISSSGFGPLTLGMTYADATALLGDHGWRIGCGAGIEAETLFWGSSVAAGTSGAGTITSISLLPEAGFDPHTALGIGFDSTLDEVAVAYPSAAAVTSFGQGYSGFRITDDRGTMFAGSRTGALVEMIAVTSDDVAPMEYCG